MTLQPPVLDDLDWEQMVEAIRRRVPAESGGAWTLHAPVDPGITLLELFAYLLEQRLFWLDQVPDALVLAVLRLLGLGEPKPAQAAGTVLRLRAGQPGEAPPMLPEGTVFARDPQQQVAFTVAATTTVLPVDDAGIRLWAGSRERTADLVAQRPVPLIAPGTGPAEARVLLPLSGDPAADPRPAAGSALSLLMRIASPDGCPAAWLPDAAVTGVQPPADLVWSWYLPDAADPSTGTDLPAVDPKSVDDGTAGLRRSGVLRLPLPVAWCAGAAGPAPAAYGLRLSTSAATFSVAPALLQVVPNTVPATHQRELRATGPDVAEQTRAWLRLPGQHLDLPGARGVLLSADVTITRDGTAQAWTAVADRTASGPADRVFVLDRETGSIRFGDGLNGAIPVPDADPVTAAPLLDVRYTVGGGAAGNGGLTGNWTLVPDPGGRASPGGRGRERGAGRGRRGTGDDRRGPGQDRGLAGRGDPGGHRRGLPRPGDGHPGGGGGELLRRSGGAPAVPVLGRCRVRSPSGWCRASPTRWAGWRTTATTRCCSPTRARWTRSPAGWPRPGCSAPRCSSGRPGTGRWRCGWS